MSRCGRLPGRRVTGRSRPTVSPSRPLVLAALGALYLVWGSTYLVMRWALEGFPPLWMGAVRFSLAGGLMLCVLKARGAAWHHQQVKRVLGRQRQTASPSPAG